MEHTIKAGFSQREIIPKIGALMDGYRMRRTGAIVIHDNLKATCAVLGDGSTLIALISLDLPDLNHDLSELQDAGVSVAQSEVPGIAFNRKLFLSDGSFALNLEPVAEKDIKCLPGAIFVEYGIELKKTSQKPYCLIFGNTNGSIQ